MDTKGELPIQRKSEISHRKLLLSFFKKRLRHIALMHTASKKNYWAFKRKFHLLPRRKKFKTVITYPPPLPEDEEEDKGGVSISPTPEVPRKALPCDSIPPQPALPAGQQECVEEPAELPKDLPIVPIRIASKSSASKIKSKISRFFIPGIEKRNQAHANAFVQNLETLLVSVPTIRNPLLLLQKGKRCSNLSKQASESRFTQDPSHKQISKSMSGRFRKMKSNSFRILSCLISTKSHQSPSARWHLENFEPFIKASYNACCFL